MSAATTKRPFLLTLLGVIGIIQGIVTLLGGIALIAERNDDDLVAHADVSSTTLGWTGGYLIVLGAITLVVAIGLLRGSDAARFILAVVALFHIGGGVYVLFFHDGTQRWDGLVTILIALLVLWILYGSTRTEDFFESRSSY